MRAEYMTWANCAGCLAVFAVLGWVLGLCWLSLCIAVLDGKEKKQLPVTKGVDGRM
jgi:hypothetical protein